MSNQSIGVVLSDVAENSGLANGVAEAQKMRASMILQQASKAALNLPWMKGSLRKWINDDAFEQCLRTTIGDFRVIIRRG